LKTQNEVKITSDWKIEMHASTIATMLDGFGRTARQLISDPEGIDNITRINDDPGNSFDG
jgi:hypothetical protein